MARKKVKLVLIANESARKVTFKKRKKGLMKKVRELSTLCGIQACAIVYSPYDGKPETWPPNLGGVDDVLTRFKMIPQMDQCKNMVSHEKFLADRIKKTTGQINKYDREYRQKEVDQTVIYCLTGRIALQGLSMGNLELITHRIDTRIKEIDQRMAELSHRGDGGNVQMDGGDGGPFPVPVDLGGVTNEVVLQIADCGGVGGDKEEYVQGVQGQPIFMEAMMNQAPMEDELMMMVMQHGASTGGQNCGESSSNFQAVSNGNSKLVWSSSTPFFC